MNSQNWFRIDAKWMRNGCEISFKKSNFVKNHETVAQENLLFPGNPIPKQVHYVQLEYKINKQTSVHRDI